MTKDFESIKKIVNKFDPIHLLESTSDNEYDNEIHKIISLLKEGDDVGAVADKIYQVFVDSFDEQTAGEKEVYLAIAKEIVI